MQVAQIVAVHPFVTLIPKLRMTGVWAISPINLVKIKLVSPTVA